MKGIQINCKESSSETYRKFVDYIEEKFDTSENVELEGIQKKFKKYVEEYKKPNRMQGIIEITHENQCFIV